MSNEKQESLADIVADMRKSDCDEICPWWADGGSCDFCPLGRNGKNCSFSNYADRIEAAWERESKAIATENAVLPAVCITNRGGNGNAAEMREALEHALEEYESLKEDDCFEDGDCNLCDEKNELCWMEKSVRLIRAALSAPARNCDVGTAEEQQERYIAFCDAHPCCECPFSESDECSLAWAQMPYKKGATK